MRRGYTWLAVWLAVCLLTVLAGCSGGEDASSAQEEASVQETVSSDNSNLPTETQSATSQPFCYRDVEAPVSPDVVSMSGRCPYTETGVSLIWTASSFSVRFRGRGIAVELCPEQEAASDDLIPYVRFIVDGKESEGIPIKQAGWYEAADALGAGEHTLTVVRLSEAGTVAPLRALNVRVKADSRTEAMLLPPPEVSPRRLLFIGDSITCGFGNLGQPYSATGVRGKFTTAEQDGMKTFAYRTAVYYGADAQYVALSGKGVCRNNNKSTTGRIPDFFLQTTPGEKETYDVSDWQPDVVVINAGTNDRFGGTGKEEMRQGVSAFLREVRSSWPDAGIVWMYGLMGQQLAKPIEAGVADFAALPGEQGRVSFLLMDQVKESKGETGTLGHPNAAAQQAASAPLIEEIRRLTGWTEQQ